MMIIHVNPTGNKVHSSILCYIKYLRADRTNVIMRTLTDLTDLRSL